jgi:hypothetical protein
MSNLNEKVCEYNSTPITENFAAKNGGGIIDLIVVADL